MPQQFFKKFKKLFSNNKSKTSIKRKPNKTKSSNAIIIDDSLTEDEKRNALAKSYETGSYLVDYPAGENATNNKAVFGDSMYNLISSMGVQGVAKTPATSFQAPRIYTPRDLEYFYAGNGIMRKIIDTQADEMTREWINLEGDDEEEHLKKYLEKLSAQKQYADLIRWSSLFGGSLIIMLIDDGRSLIEEVDLNNIRKIEKLWVVDLGQIYLYPTDYYSDPADPKFNEPEWFTIRPIFYGVPSKNLMFKVHETRVLKMDGAPVTQFLKSLNRGWMAPITQSYMWDIINLEQSYTYAVEAVHEMVVTVFGIKDLAMKLSTDKGVEEIKKRMDVVLYAKSVINAVIMDADGEKFEKVMTNISQIADLLTKLERKLCATCGIPYSVLFGEQRGGLNQGESSDVRMWYDTIKRNQAQNVTPLLKKLIHYISLCDDCDFEGDMEEISISYNNLWQYEEKDLVGMKLQQAQADAIYIDRGVVTPEEIRERFLDDVFDFELQIKSEETVTKDFDEKTKDEINKKTEEISISKDMNTNTLGK